MPEILDDRRDASGGYKVDVSRGGHDGRVSSEWFSRPDDEKLLSLSDLYTSVKSSRRAQPHTDGRKRRDPPRCRATASATRDLSPPLSWMG